MKPKTLEQFADVWYYGYNANPSRRRDRWNETRYRILNLHQLLSGRLKTVEFRLFNSTLHAGKVKAYIQLSLLIAVQALSQKKATPRITESENGNDKYTFRVWLLRLGAISDE
ncbi:amidoligase family protein, partial [Rhizobium ruizarguesonis]